MDPSQGPPQMPPADVFYEYDGQRLVDLSIAFLVLETVCVGLRLMARRIGKAGVGLDDILIIPSFILCAALPAIAIASVEHAGVGRHAEALLCVNPQILVRLGKLVFASTVVYLFAAVLPKLVILALYLRIFPNRPYRIAIYFLAGVIISNLVGCFIAAMLECIPLELNWDPTIPGGHCVNRIAFFEYASLINIISDVAMMILPVPMIWKLNTNRSTKLGVTLIFLTGSIGLVTSIIRIVKFSNFDHSTTFADLSWGTAELTLWTVLEPGIYLVAACLPTYRPLLLWCIGRDPKSGLPSADASKARLWLNRAFERTGRKKGTSASSAKGRTYGRPSAAQYSANTGLAKASRDHRDSYAMDAMDRKHAVAVFRRTDV